MKPKRSFEADRSASNARSNYERLKELHTKKFVGEKEFLDAKTDFKLSELNLEIAQARLEERRGSLENCYNSAPRGYPTLINVTDGQVISGATSVSNGTDLLTIAQLSELYMEAKPTKSMSSGFLLVSLLIYASTPYPILRSKVA